MKKLFVLIIMLLVVASLPAVGVEDFDIDEETGYITGYYGDETELAVPETIDDVAVKGIDDCAFQVCKQITSITLPEGMVFIGEYAFQGCSSLASISIPASVETIGASAFEGCEALATVSLPKKAISIGDRAFKNCKSIRSLRAPNCLSAIGAEAFCGCSSLEAFRFTSRSRLASLGASAFKDCSSLQAVILANGLSTIPKSAFENCSNLVSVKIPSNLESIESKAFKNCRKLGAIDIPEGVATVGEQAFHGCRNIADIVIPASVTDIGQSAFTFCGGLGTQNLTPEQTQPLYKIGDKGPAGGMIFYVDEEDIYPEWDYLETSTVKDGIGEYQFGYYYADGSKSRVGTGTCIGDGRSNTERLVAAMGETAWGKDGERNVSEYAAKMCADYSVTRDGVVYDDWFLPSKDELDLVYWNLQKPGLSEFSASWCWSSSEYDYDYARCAWLQSFDDDGNKYCFDRYYFACFICVRPVRAF